MKFDKIFLDILYFSTEISYVGKCTRLAKKLNSQRMILRHNQAITCASN